ncbi:MAG: response regulator [Alphaproteobacteria bacterium]|nr:response regulator [Alphaproteobacteria bacterium]
MVLLVEDNIDHAELVMDSLRDRCDLPVHHSADGVDALQAIDDAVPSLVLLDLRLPRVDGLTFLERMRSTPGCEHVPVVVLTTSAAELDIENAYARGATAYLVKPTRYDELDAMVGSVADFWLRWNRGVGA